MIPSKRELDAFSAAVQKAERPTVTLTDEQATTHEKLTKAACKVEEANRILTDAQSEFRAALAAHLKAITGAKVEP